jgi:hypothetical protein
VERSQGLLLRHLLTSLTLGLFLYILVSEGIVNRVYFRLTDHVEVR